MLKLKYLFENYDLAKEALGNWEHDADTLDEMLSRFRISSNAIYPFCQNGRVCFLRLAPLEEKLEKNVFGELEFIDYLCSCGYPALEPVPAKKGEICLKLDTQWGGYYAAVFRRVDGIAIEDTDLSDKIMYAYGKALGRLHTLSACFFEPKTKKWTHEEALEWTRSVLSEYLQRDRAAAQCDEIKRELDGLEMNSDLYGLIHYDFEPDNVFYDEDKNACAVIDFDDGMYHWFALDIEQVFESLEDVLFGEPLRAAKEEFIRGYREEHCFTKEMEASLPLMRRFINLYSSARLVRCTAEQYAQEPEWMVNLRRKLEKVISKKEAEREGIWKVN